jgi:hypothetical protein
MIHRRLLCAGFLFRSLSAGQGETSTNPEVDPESAAGLSNDRHRFLPIFIGAVEQAIEQ